MTAPHIEDTTTDHDSDLAAIRQVIADAERAGEDVGAAAERFTRWLKTGS